jgi:hypothetical protein
MSKIEIREYFAKIDDLIIKNCYDQAIHHCLYLLRQFPKMISIYELLGRVYLETDNYYGALEIYSRLLSAKPDTLLNYISLEFIFGKINQFEYQQICKKTAAYLRAGDAQNQGEKLLDKDIQDYLPDTIETSFITGKKHYDERNYEKAASEFEKAFHGKPSYSLYELFWGLACAESNLNDTAALIFQNILKKNPYYLNALRFHAYYSYEKDPIEYSRCIERLSELDPNYQNASISGKHLIPGSVDLFVNFQEWTGFPNRKLLSGRLFSGDKFLENKTGFLPNWLSLLPVNMDLLSSKPQTASAQDEMFPFSQKGSIFTSNFREEDTFFQMDYFRSQIIKDSNLNKSKAVLQPDLKSQTNKPIKKSNLDEAFNYLEQVMTESEHTESKEKDIPLSSEIADESGETSVIHPNKNDESIEKIREAWNCFSTGEQARGIAIYRDLIKNQNRLESVREDIQKLIVLFPENQELSQLIS